MPEPGNPQALNRYSYVLNNPIRYTDPTGHRECERHCPQETIRPDINTAYAGPWNPAAQARRTQAARQATGAAIDFTPVVGDAKGLVEVFTGSDLVTGERLGAWRWLGLLGLSEVRHLRHADEIVGLASGAGHRLTGLGGGRLAADEGIIVFESYPGSGRIKAHDPEGQSAQSLAVAGSPEQAYQDAFKRPPKLGEPYWQTTAGQIESTGRFAYLDAVGSPGHVSIYGGYYLNPIEFIKIWTRMTFGQ